MDFYFLLWIFSLGITLSEEAQKGSGRRRKAPPTCPKDCKCQKVDRSRAFEAKCRSIGLNNIPESFNEDPSWTDVDMSINNITSIGKNSLKPLLMVERLKLSFNRISDIHPSSFQGLQRLDHLNLRGNRISAIPPRLFSNSPNIQHLNLQANLISSLTAESFIGLHNLVFLYLDNNHLKSIPVEALRQTPQLQVLSLPVNQIESIPDGAFTLLSKLNVLNLRENRIKEVGNEAMSGIRLCNILDLSTNLLTEYPKTITELTHLTDLSIENNQIKTLPDRAFARQSDLETLSFQNNLLTSVGRWTFTNLRRIKSLELVNVTEQEYFPDLSGCASLQKLSVTEGRIYTIPHDLCGPKTKLESLNVANNKLYNLTGISNCFNLKTLDAKGNSFSSLQKEEIKNLTMLETLILSDNDISFLDDHVFESTNLENLNLAENPFSFLPVKGLSHLRSLNVSGCPNLLYFPPIELFEGLRQLEATYAYHCCQITKTARKKSESKLNGDEVPSISCFPEPGPLTPCENLLDTLGVRIVLWIVLIASVVLNLSIILFSAVTRCISAYKQSQLVSSSTNEDEDKDAKKYDSGTSSTTRQSYRVGTFEIALCHLALADLIASIYLAIIVSYDSQTRGEFAKSGSWWQQSSSCKTAGFCLVMGLQMGFFTILIAAVERYLSTMFPLNPEKHFGKTVMSLTLIAAWIIAIATAVVTLYSGNERTLDYFDNPFPSNNGAACLPWSTDFPYVAVLVGAHVLGCAAVVFLCAFMYCARRKRSWLSAQKHTRCQITLVVACNVMFLLPLALIGLLASAIATYPSSTQPWLSSQNAASAHFMYNTTELNVELLLTSVMLLLSLRLLLNPVLYIGFSEDYRRKFVRLVKMFSCLKRKERHNDYDSGDYGDDDGATSRMVAAEFAYQDGTTLSPFDRYAILQRVPLHLIPSTEDNFSEEREFYQHQFLSPAIHEHRETGDHSVVDGGEEDEEEFIPMLHSCNEQSQSQSLEEDAATTPDWPNEHQKITVYPDYRSDPFTNSNQSHTGESFYYPRVSDPLPSSQKAMFWNSDPSENDTCEHNIPGPSQPDTSLLSTHRTRPKYWSAVVQETKKRLPPLTLQKYGSENQTLCTVGGQILMQSCESSTSKDSGIQSEPDFGAGIACSSGCSTLSRTGRGKLCNENTVPMVLVSSQIGGHYALQPLESCMKNTNRYENDYKVIRSNGQNQNKYFVLSSTKVDNRRAKLKTETVL